MRAKRKRPGARDPSEIVPEPHVYKPSTLSALRSAYDRAISFDDALSEMREMFSSPTARRFYALDDLN